jgi:glycosyltransferase involved in cell wall biosynthesis
MASQASDNSCIMRNKSTTHIPTISVVMSAYNEAAFLRESLESILNQTFPDFELIVVNDASTDNTGAILDEYARLDSRIKVIHNSRNLRMAASVNKAVEVAQGRYIARMDADDISELTRFEKQIAYLEKHPKTVAVGTQCVTIDKDGNITGEKIFPLAHPEIYDYICKFVPVQQPSMMIAYHRLPKGFVMHNTHCRIGEEIELLFKLFQYGKVENLPEKLLRYRIHANNTSFLNVKESFFNTFRFRIQAIFKYGYRPSLGGIVVSLMQAVVISALPKPAIMFIYSNMRFIRTSKEKAYAALQSVKLGVAQ